MNRDERYIRILERTIARLEQQNRDLLDRLMHVSGQPWNVAPAELPHEIKLEPEDGGWTSDPSQLVEDGDVPAYAELIEN